LPGGNADFRVEFVIRKMHSQHLHMPNLNLAGAKAA
jgi:hypothetical protein